MYGSRRDQPGREGVHAGERLAVLARIVPAVLAGDAVAVLDVRRCAFLDADARRPCVQRVRRGGDLDGIELDGVGEFVGQKRLVGVVFVRERRFAREVVEHRLRKLGRLCQVDGAIAVVVSPGHVRNVRVRRRKHLRVRDARPNPAVDRVRVRVRLEVHVADPDVLGQPRAGDRADAFEGPAAPLSSGLADLVGESQAARTRRAGFGVALAGGAGRARPFCLGGRWRAVPVALQAGTAGEACQSGPHNPEEQAPAH